MNILYGVRFTRNQIELARVVLLRIIYIGVLAGTGVQWCRRAHKPRCALMKNSSSRADRAGTLVLAEEVAQRGGLWRRARQRGPVHYEEIAVDRTCVRAG
jgi:hypothetical protein